MHRRGRRSSNPKDHIAKNKKATLLRLWKYLSYYKAKFITGIVLTVFANALSLIGPYLTGQMINEMWYSQETANINLNRIFLLAGLMISFYMISAIMNYFLSVALVKISQSVVYKLRADLFYKLSHVSINYYDTNQTGDTISRMSYDIDSISTTISADLINLITSSITLVVSFVMMIIVSPLLLLIYFVTIPLSFFITTKLSKVIKQKFRKRNQQLGQMNGFAEEMITAQKTIQSYVQEENVYKEFQKENELSRDLSYDSGAYSAMVGPSINFVNNFGTFLVATAGAIFVAFGQILVGDLSSFMLYSRRFSGPINQLSNLIADIQSALAAAERVFSVIDEPDEQPDLPDAKGDGINKGLIEFDDVSFEYVKDTPVLNNITFKAKPGQTIAIVGETGAGKTTLVNLLMRFYELNSGTIKLDGTSIDEYQRSYYRKSYSMVLQDTWLFHGSVYDNIRYGNGEVTMEEVIEAAKKARIHNYIEGLTEGYSTIITGDGVNISKGQKQLIVIARAILSKSLVLILDEATSNVDTYTEINIQQAMQALMTNKTSFVIAHRLSTIQNADLILHIRNGNLIEKGTHEELIQSKGPYYTMFMSQFS